MSATAIASLRPFGHQCLHRSHAALLTVQLKSPKAKFELSAVVSLRRGQIRFASQKRFENDGRSEAPIPRHKLSPLPKLTFRQFLRRVALGSFRNLRSSLTAEGWKAAWRDSPYFMSMVIVVWIVFLGFLAATLPTFYRTFYGPEMSKFPEPVANTLRRAIYYTISKPEPELALKYYQKAMQECADIGLDPFSDEVLGIRIYVAGWLEKIGNYANAIQVIESIRSDCLRWVDVMEQSVKDGKISEAGRLVSEPKPTQDEILKDGQEASTKDAAKPQAQTEEEKDMPTETLWHKRQRLLQRAISASVKLGHLYADEHVIDPENSHKHLLWAVEASLKEMDRRRKEDTKPGEESWLTAEEMGASMESLGLDYMKRSQFQFAIPLFFQALRLCESPCHRAVIMNNLSAAFAQHPIYSPKAAEMTEVDNLKVLFDSSMPSTRAECLEAAAAWARNAYAHGKDVKGEQRTPDCDEACAVALCNWGDVAAMQGKPELARGKYQKCIEMSEKLGFAAGAKQAREGLAKLSGTATQPKK
ncbi:hypothetical protein B0I35DRAFT_126555 [Stachybotrys elegans]|uniref:Uncharacterized protein n=1 Tax=Stachybotrys elegans TaxID=80388 RepID=A0A8K0WVF6_9HYPO|nr:hypothetical protein B0I35DRAFT_126555 [Stachybotrys elegans]